MPSDFDNLENVVNVNLLGTHNVVRLTAARMAASAPSTETAAPWCCRRRSLLSTARSDRPPMSHPRPAFTD